MNGPDPAYFLDLLRPIIGVFGDEGHFRLVNEEIRRVETLVDPALKAEDPIVGPGIIGGVEAVTHGSQDKNGIGEAHMKDVSAAGHIVVQRQEETAP